MMTKLKFRGELDDLKRLVKRAGFQGQWRREPNGCWHFRQNGGSGMHWSSTQGTIWFDESSWKARDLRNRIMPLLMPGAGMAAPITPAIEAAEDLEHLLRRLRDDATRALHAFERMKRRFELDDEDEGPKRRQSWW